MVPSALVRALHPLEDMVTMRPERSVLAVPASNWQMIEKAAKSAADLVFIDLDDSVAPAQKAGSRANVIKGLNDLDWGRKARAFRMNALSTPFAYRDLVEVVEGAGRHLDLILLPKADRPEDVYLIDTLLTQIEEHMGFERRIGLEIQIETARSMMTVDEIAFASERIEALVFGPGDYSSSVQMPVANIGEPDTWDAEYPGHRWHYAMHRIVVAARAAGLRAIDGPFAGLDNPKGFRQSCRQARSLGFDGKWCVHPSQVVIASEVFTPDAAEVQYAREVIEAYEKGVAEGRGAILFRGKMVDAASLKVAQNVLDKARQNGMA